MDEFDAALSYLAPKPKGMMSAALSPREQAASDAMERGPTGNDGYAQALATASPADRADLIRSRALVQPQQDDGFDAALTYLSTPPKATNTQTLPVAKNAGGGRGFVNPSMPLSRDEKNNAPMALVSGATSIGANVIGGLHGIAKLVTGGSLDDAANAVSADQQKYTYTPKAGTDAANVIEAFHSPYNPVNWPGMAGQWAGGKLSDLMGSSDSETVRGLAPAVATATEVGTGLIGPGLLVKGAKALPISQIGKAAEAAAPAVESATAPAVSAPKPRYRMVNGKLTQVDPGSPTAAPMAAMPTLEQASPALQQAAAEAKKAGTVNTVALQRHVEADTLPVPVRLTEGQALMDPETISQEMNSRGGKGALVSPDFYNAQGRALAQNLDAIRSQVAPEVKAVNPLEHGQVLIDEIKAMDAQKTAQIDANYQALRDAAGGDFPVDATALLGNVKAALKKQLLSHDAPPSQMAELESLAADGSMSFEQFLSLRRNLGAIARTAQDGNVRTAAGTMVKELESLPLKGGAADLKPLADKARASAKARFDAMDADPAYKAVANDAVGPGEASPLADSFVQKYLIGAPRANIARLRQNLSDSQIAQQTIPAATVDYLRARARAEVDSGKFNAATYGETVNKLQPKFDVLMDPKSAQQVKQVANVARYTTVQPKGSFVNNSHTLVGLGLDVAKRGISNMANVATGGVSGVVQDAANVVRQNKAAKKATAPGAGLTKLSDLPGVKPAD